MPDSFHASPSCRSPSPWNGAAIRDAWPIRGAGSPPKVSPGLHISFSRAPEPAGVVPRAGAPGHPVVSGPSEPPPPMLVLTEYSSDYQAADMAEIDARLKALQEYMNRLDTRA